jgi:hypothetical protein
LQTFGGFCGGAGNLSMMTFLGCLMTLPGIVMIVSGISLGGLGGFSRITTGSGVFGFGAC